MSTLLLAAHPDDEILGTSAELLDRRCVVAHVTDGVPHHHSAAASANAAGRLHESALAAEALGARVDRRGLGFTDLQTWLNVFDVTTAVVHLLDELAPSEVLVPAYQRAHPDHDTVYVASLLARATHPDSGGTRWRVYSLYGLDPRGTLRFDHLDADYYGTVQPQSLAPDALERKARAVRCFASQLGPGSLLQRWLDDPTDEVRADLPPRSRPLPDLPSGYDSLLRLTERFGTEPSRIDTTLHRALTTSPTALWRHHAGRAPRPNAANG